MPEDISLGILGPDHGPPLPRKSATMFFFLVMLDFYRMAVRSSGDATLPNDFWVRKYNGIIFTIQPHSDGSMRYSHVFYGTAWIWLWMADLTPDGPNPSSGYYERMYVILRKGAPSEHRLGYIQVRLAPAADST